MQWYENGTATKYLKDQSESKKFELVQDMHLVSLEVDLNAPNRSNKLHKDSSTCTLKQGKSSMGTLRG